MGASDNDIQILARLLRPWTVCDDGGRFDHGSFQAAQAVLQSDWLAAHDAKVRADALAPVREAHPVTVTRRCGNRLSTLADPPPGPPNPPVWCARLADGHGPDQCRTWEGHPLAAYVRAGRPVEVRPPVVTYRCETCRTPQDPHSPAPCATLRALPDATEGGEDRGCTCGTDATSLNPAEVVVHRTDGPCYIAPTSAEGDE